MDPAFILEQIFYWLSLATWFGGVMFITVAAPIIFRTIRESDPTLPTVLSVNLEGEHSTLLAGTLVANLLVMLQRVEVICAAILGLTLIAQWALLFHVQLGLLVLRTALFVAAAILLGYDWWMVSPRIFAARQRYIDNADDPETANPAREQFDRLQRESITVVMFELFALTGLVLFSAGISASRSFNVL